MCTKCGSYYQFNTNNQQAEAAKIMFAKGAANLITEVASGVIGLFGYGFEQNYSQPVRGKREIAEEKPVNEKPQDTNNLQKEVEDILETAKLTVSEEVLEEVVKKYAVMKQFNKSTTPLETRVINYAKALSNYGRAEEAFRQGDSQAVYEIAGVKDAKAEGSMEKYIAAYEKAADEYIELCDDKYGDGKISFIEYIAHENANAGIDIDSLSNEEAITKFAAEYIAFQALDLDQSGWLEKNEVAGMINWTSVQDDNGENITFADNQSFGEDIANYVISTLGLNEEDTKSFIEYMKVDNRGAALKLLKEKTNLGEKEFSNIVNAFKGYGNAVAAFTKT